MASLSLFERAGIRICLQIAASGRLRPDWNAYDFGVGLGIPFTLGERLVQECLNRHLLIPCSNQWCEQFGRPNPMDSTEKCWHCEFNESLLYCLWQHRGEISEKVLERIVSSLREERA